MDARRGPWFAAALITLAVVELAWLLWYWTVPLPNAEAAKTMLPDGSTQSVALRRWYLLAQALPYFVPDTKWDESFLGMTLNKLGHVEHLHQRLGLIGAGTWIAAGALGLGLLALRGLRLSATLTTPARFGLAFGLGATLLGVCTLGLGRLGWLSPALVRIGLTVLAIGGVGAELLASKRANHSRSPTRPWPLVSFALVSLPFLILMALGSLQPSLDFDSLEYHLQGPKEWYLGGRITFLPHNVYTTMPFNVEMLHLLGMYVMGDWWHGALVGQFLVMLHAPFAALMIGLAASRLGSSRAGWVAALVYLSTPWVYRLSVFAYVEGPLGYYHAAALCAAVLAWSSPLLKENGRFIASLWGVVGTLTGGAMACKYPSLISAVVPFGAFAWVDTWRRRLWLIPIAFAIGLALTVGPWLAKNVVDHGNPVYPLGNSVFRGHPWSESREQQWKNAHGPRPVTLDELQRGVLDVAGRNDWQSPLFLALAPLAFLRKGSRRAAAVLWSYAIFIFATWWLLTHRLDRFWLPILPPLAVLAGLGADWSRRMAWTALLYVVMAMGLFSNLVYNTTELAALNRWTDDLNVLRRDVPTLASPTLSWLDTNLPPGAKVLLIGQAGVFHMKHEHLYNTVFDEEIIETLARGRTPQQVRSALKERGVTHILVDWAEIARHRKPGGYGFTEFVQPDLFEEWMRAGIMESLAMPLPQKGLYEVR